MRLIAITPNKLDDLDPQEYIKSFPLTNNPDLIIVRDTNASFATKLEFANGLRKFSKASISINAKINDFAIQKDISFGLHMNAVELKEGQKIKVNSGPFLFKKGTINKISCNKVIISIESINISLVLNKSSVVAA